MEDVNLSNSSPNFSFCLFVLIHYVPVNNFSAMSGRVFLGLTSTKQRIKCIAQGHNIVPLVRLESVIPIMCQAPHR